MILLISVLRYAITFGGLFGFPALAISALRRGGRRRLATVTALSFAVIVAFALMAAARRFGNVHGGIESYASVAMAVTALFSLTLGLPLITAAVAVLMLRHDRLPFWAVYAATVGAAAFGWIMGIIGALWVF